MIGNLRKTIYGCMLVSLLSYPFGALAYKEPTHMAISGSAASSSSSVLSKPEKLNDMGFLFPIENEKQQFPNSNGIPKSIIKLIQDGANFEDSDWKSVNHFFNPVTNQALSIVPNNNTSPDWALEDNGDVNLLNPGGSQNFSYKDARQYFYEALTTVDNVERNKKMGLTFQTLGQVIHHVQDMAQPQHVRNDLHLDQGDWRRFGVQLNRLYNPSAYEIFSLNAVISAIYPDLDFETFRTPRSFWTNPQNKGLAQFTNSNFVSAGTNFDKPDATAYPLPVFGGYTDINKVQVKLASELCLEQGTQCDQVFKDNPSSLVTFFGTDVVDQYHLQLNAVNPRASAKSIFDDELTKAGKTAVFSLNKFNFAEANKLLIPRAVAYSTGLVNYFFRGKMEISLPDEGVYGVLDHNDPASNAKDTGGFTKIKLKIQNLTPRGEDIEIMPLTGGKLTAVVKFHRNNCYVSDLSGEYGSPGMDWNTCREKDEEIVVSTEIDAPLGINDRPSQVEFIFPTPVPINGTDLFLQVVYRGGLGDEPQAVVVATKDISEPSYIYNYGSHLWDQFTYGSAWPVVSAGTGTYAWWCSTGFSTIDACNQAMGSTIKLQFMPTASYAPGYDPAIVAMGQWIDRTEQPTTLSPVATLVAPIGSFARIAVLMDAQPANYVTYVTEKIDTTHDTRSPPGVFMWLGGIMSPTINQQDPITKNLIPSVKYIKARGVFLPDYATEVLDNFSPFVLIPSQISPDW